jgi:hypothetical protein
LRFFGRAGGSIGPSAARVKAAGVEKLARGPAFALSQ